PEADIWHRSRNSQLDRISSGKLDLPEPGPNQMYVKLHPDDFSHTNVYEAGGDRWRIVEWDPNNPTSPRDWDMGHTTGNEYRTLKQEYLSGQYSTKEFLKQYLDPNKYEVSDPYRNSSHTDELTD
ncbi:GH-E family nuclease, partial [Gulosibacter bifidus]